jgi:hypothetical protein
MQVPRRVTAADGTAGGHPIWRPWIRAQRDSLSRQGHLTLTRQPSTRPIRSGRRSLWRRTHIRAGTEVMSRDDPGERYARGDEHRDDANGSTGERPVRTSPTLTQRPARRWCSRSRTAARSTDRRPTSPPRTSRSSRPGGAILQTACATGTFGAFTTEHGHFQSGADQSRPTEVFTPCPCLSTPAREPAASCCSRR